MSSFIRRLQIRAFRKRGYDRATFKIVMIAGKEQYAPVRRGGVILDPDAKPIGYHWPRFLSSSEPPEELEAWNCGKSGQRAERKHRRKIYAVPANPAHSTRRERALQHRLKMVRKGHRRPHVIAR